MNTGVYVIANTVSGKLYVGSSSRSLARRRRNHLYDLEEGVHHCQPLQRAWLKHGGAALVFAVVEETAPEDAVSREQHYMGLWKPEYNLCPVAGSQLGLKHTEEARARMKAGAKLANMRPEVKARRSQGSKEAWALPGARAARIASANRADVKERKGESVRKSWADQEIVQRRLTAMAQAFGKPEEKARKSAATAKCWAGAEYRQTHVDAMRARWADPEYRKQMSAMSRETHALPDSKAKRSAALSSVQRAKTRVTPEVLTAIQMALAVGERGASIAQRHGIAATVVSEIKHGKHWSQQP